MMNTTATTVREELKGGLVLVLVLVVLRAVLPHLLMLAMAPKLLTVQPFRAQKAQTHALIRSSSSHNLDHLRT